MLLAFLTPIPVTFVPTTVFLASWVLSLALLLFVSRLASRHAGRWSMVAVVAITLTLIAYQAVPLFADDFPWVCQWWWCLLDRTLGSGVNV